MGNSLIAELYLYIKKINKMKYMIAVDGSAQAHKTLEIIQKIGKDNDEVVVTIVTKPKNKEKANEIMKKTLEEINAGEKKFKTVDNLVEGKDARPAIVEECKKHNVDILVMGRRGLSAIESLFVGSVSQYCLYQAHCDVMLAH